MQVPTTAEGIAAQAVGLAAMVCGLTAFWSKSDRRFFTVLLSAHTLFCLHFALLGAWAGAGANAVGVARVWLARDRKGWGIGLAFCAAYVAMGAVTFREPIDALPIAAPVAGTLAMFTLSGIAMRGVLLGATCMWLTYNVANGSIGGSVNEAVILAVNAATIYRMARDARKARSA